MDAFIYSQKLMFWGPLGAQFPAEYRSKYFPLEGFSKNCSISRACSVFAGYNSFKFQLEACLLTDNVTAMIIFKCVFLNLSFLKDLG